MPEDDIFRVTEEQARLGTNFMAIHTGIKSSGCGVREGALAESAAGEGP